MITPEEIEQMASGNYDLDELSITFFNLLWLSFFFRKIFSLLMESNTKNLN